MVQPPFEGCIGFDWDEHNSVKNWDWHRVTPEEAEEVFFGKPVVVRSDVRHSEREKRYLVLGRTTRERKLFLVCTIRQKMIRVISVRDMNRRERVEYERYEKEDS